MGRISVKPFDTRGSLGGHSSGTDTGGKITGHTPVENSYSPDAVTSEEQGCCEHDEPGAVSVALKVGTDAPCSATNAPVAKACDSVFRGGTSRPMTSVEHPIAPPAGNTDSVAKLGPSKALETGDSVSNPGFGFRNGGGNNDFFRAPGLPKVPGRPEE